MEPRWIVSTSASSLHGAAAMLAGSELVDKKVSEALAGEVQGLGGDLAAVGLAPSRFFEHAIALAVRFDVPLRWAEVVIAKTFGPNHPTADLLAARFARRLIALEAALQQANPRALEELELRSEPLREQWAARGPGLLASVARQTAADLVVDEADVILVHPALGGGGSAHPLYNSVCIEAVLANPLAELPEVVRLGWLLAQLNLDLPKYQEHLPGGAARDVGRLAMIPPVLAAAEEVELARFDDQTLATALAAWNAPAVEPGKLLAWWETYRATNPDWAVALGALERMLSSP
jgi:hypothetical protein